uniref:Nuclear receptor subfamily 1 group D member 2-like n=1 Tax=Saccoglossus kowalevskii TaxID=10224 RepID=A0ABM0MQ83_SACKO|nr:PREDICTED: nuclear receptor subfamily 1 group D member 2-like [Saccoglossus kowalevskii]
MAAPGFDWTPHEEGFYRRSIVKHSTYECLRKQCCVIDKYSRNRCAYCRWQKCLEEGMSKDAVKFGRIPNREKELAMAEFAENKNDIESTIRRMEEEERQRRIEQNKDLIQSTKPNYVKRPPPPLISVPAVLPTFKADPEVIEIIQQIREAHSMACPFSELNLKNYTKHSPKRQKIEYHRSPEPLFLSRRDYSPGFINSPGASSSSSQSSSAAPSPSTSSEVSFSVSSPESLDFSMENTKVSQAIIAMIKRIVVFSKKLPGFRELFQEDQIILLKGGVFEVWMLQSCNMLLGGSNECNDTPYKIDDMSLFCPPNMIEKMVKFAEGFNKFNLTETEIALVSTVALANPGKLEICI